MKVKRIMTIGAMAAFVGSLGAGATLGAEQKQPSSGSGDNQPSAFGRVGNKGEGFSEEQAIKGKGQNPESSLGQDVQVTIGGSRPVVEGEVLKIQGEDYIIKDSSGSNVRLRVNKDTSMECGPGTGQGVAMSTGKQSDDQREIPPTAHMGEKAGGHQGQSGQSPTGGERIGDQSGTQSRSAMGKDSGGDIARGSGFVIGPKANCTYKPGDKVRAQVSDLGTVLFIKQISDKDTRSRQNSSGQMIPQEGGMMPGERAAAQQREKLLQPGAVPGPKDLQDTEHTTGATEQQSGR